MDDYYDHYNSTYLDNSEDHFYDDAHSYTSSSSVHRLLAPAGGTPTVDYAVISVVIMTLGLVLAIEVLRHQLDVLASGNPFFHTVLELMYRELTTLGIVEFCIYLMHKYQENFNYQLEVIFVDVHFMLFYTAVFNAIQSCLVRLLAGRRTDKIWIQTEDMDIRHYIGIRKEFDRIETKTKGFTASGASEHSSGFSNSNHAVDLQSSTTWQSFQESMRDLAFKIRHPHLYRKKNQLLVPIRFHELRVHFIDSNNLPPKFKVSHYLKRSLTSVLLDFVHISSAAWILLMATANLLYFLSGMILHVTRNSLEVEEFLMYIFMSLMVMFVIFAFILYFKMKSIFSKIMHMKLTVFDSDQQTRQTWRGFTALNSRNTKALDQVKLFWGGNPHLIIVATQYMQFGYALGFAMVFTYFKDFSKNHTYISPSYLLLALLACYLIFLSLVSVILPWYTLCTSMGQLVNKERLHETLAKLKLSEEIRMKESLEEERKAEEEIARRKREIEAKNAKIAAKARRSAGLPIVDFKDSTDTQGKKGGPGELGGLDDGVSQNVTPHSSAKKQGSTGLLSVFRNRSSDALEAGSPGAHFPDQQKRSDASGVESGRSWLQHARKKSLSDGVQFMMSNRSLNGSSSSSPPASPTSSGRLSAAAAHQLHSADEDEAQLIESMFNAKATHSSLDKPIHTKGERRRLKKSISDNVTFMRAMNATDHYPLETLSWLPKKPPQVSKEITPEEMNGLRQSEMDEEYEKAQSPRLRANSDESPTMLRIDESHSRPFSVENASLKTVVTNGSTQKQLIPSQPLVTPGMEEGSGTGVIPRLRANSAEMPTMLSIDESNAGPCRLESDLMQPENQVKVRDGGMTKKEHINGQPREGIVGGFQRGGSPGGIPRTRSNSEEIPQMLSIDESNADSFAHDSNLLQPVKELVRPDDGSKGNKHANSQSLIATGSHEGPGTECCPRLRSSTDEDSVAQHHPRLRSNSDQATMSQGIDESPLASSTNMEQSKKLFSDQSQLPMARKERKQRRRIMKTQSEGVAFMRTSLSNDFARSSLDSAKKEPEKLATLSELSQLSAKDLPEVPNLSEMYEPTRRRHQRKKSSSEGVAFMRAPSAAVVKLSTDDISLANTGQEINGFMPDDMEGGMSGGRSKKIGALGRQERKQRRKLMKTQSEGVASMRSSLPTEFTRQSLDSVKEKKEPEKLTTLSELTQISAKDLPEIPPFTPKEKPKRRTRLKSASEGVAFMRASKNNDSAVYFASKGQKDTLSKQQVGEAMSANEPSEPAKNKVTFLLAKTENAPAPAAEQCLKEQESFDSAASDDGESDIDDVPEALFLDDISNGSQSRMQAIAQKIDLAAFFEGSRYRIISLIFGPMACFFCVARVEIFNIFAGIFVDQTQVWYKLLTQFFWVEFSLYCIMIIEMLTVMIVFLSKRGREGGWFACSAAAFGLLINIMCLLLLVIAETKRCCSDDDKDNDIFARLLGPASSSKGYSDPASYYIECCPKFGERKYGGLGNIEPFTCLIALSPLRFFLAGYFVKLLGKGASHDGDMHTDKGAHGHHGPDPTDRVRDLWLTAIGIHSDIAKSFGLFSSELLQCMLGIYSDKRDYNHESEASVGDNESSEAKTPSSGLEESEYHEGENSLDFRSDTSSRGLTSPSKLSSHKRYESDCFGVTFDDFAYPMARLLRRMRRCERRLSPILDEWLVVDVVITSHELVIFEVIDETEGLAISSHKNGGKGLQLCDVAKGRKILSQFNLDDIDFVDIEHRAANQGDINEEDVEMNYRNNLLEYWQGGHPSSEDYEMDEMNARWENVDEDRLKIHFKYNTLFLRFMADLNEMEHKSRHDLEDPNLMNHVGTQSKLWCRTIARLRGATNLRQNLPHFGDDGSDEMEDFIELCERDHHVKRNTEVIRDKIHRRMSSFVA